MKVTGWQIIDSIQYRVIHGNILLVKIWFIAVLPWFNLQNMVSQWKLF